MKKQKITQTSVNTENRLLKADEVASILGYSRAKVYRLMQTRSIPTLTLGRNIRVPLRALMQWIEEQTTPGAAL